LIIIAKGIEMEANNGAAMTLLDHLNELRKRLFVAVIVLVITTLICLTFAQNLIEILAQPIGGLQNLQAIEVTENISVLMRVCLLAGLILAMPVIVYELMMFVMPGLTPSERKWIYLSVPVASFLFLGGVMFSYFVMLPTAIPFLVGQILQGVESRPRISNYMGFITNLMFWIGLSFETPLFVFILAKFNLVTARQLWRGWRIALVVIAVIAAMATPTVDPVNMGLLMAPLFVLYLLSVLLAFLARK